MDTSIADPAREPWNEGKLVGQKTPFETESGGFSFSKPHSRIASPLDSPVPPNCEFLGSSSRIGPSQLWHPYAKSDEGHPDLPTHKESAGLSSCGDGRRPGSLRHLIAENANR
jgi:hypothetical protein